MEKNSNCDEENGFFTPNGFPPFLILGSIGDCQASPVTVMREREREGEREGGERGERERERGRERGERERG